MNSTTSVSSIPSPSLHKRPPPSDSAPLSDDLHNGIPSTKSSITNSPSLRSSSPRDNNNKDDAQSYNNHIAQTSTTTTVASNDGGNNTNEVIKVSRPAPVSSSGRSTDSISSQASNNGSSPRDRSNHNSGGNHDEESHSTSILIPQTRNELGTPHLEDSNESGENLVMDDRKALDLHIGRYTNGNHENGSVDMEHDQDSRPPTDDRSEHHGISIPDHEMDDTYDDDEDEHFSLSIQPEVSLRESDESFSLDRHDRRLHHATNFANSFGGNHPLLGSSSMSITPTAPNSSSGWSISSQLSLQQQMTLKHLSKLARPMMPKSHHGQQSGQSSPHSGGSFGGINEGILMRMMREPLQSGSSKSLSSSSGQTGFFDSPHGDP
jgi:hypothetical protein